MSNEFTITICAVSAIVLLRLPFIFDCKKIIPWKRFVLLVKAILWFFLLSAIVVLAFVMSCFIGTYCEYNHGFEPVLFLWGLTIFDFLFAFTLDLMLLRKKEVCQPEQQKNPAVRKKMQIDEFNMQLKIKNLDKLLALREKGVITQEEYKSARKELLQSFLKAG